MLNEPKKQADVLELLMLGVDVGFWETAMKPPENNFGPATPDTPNLTVTISNPLSTRISSGTAGFVNFTRGNKLRSNKKSKTSNNLCASPNFK